MPATLLICFEPERRSSVVASGTNLLEAARKVGIQLTSNCNGQGECGECCVVILEGQVSPLTAEEADSLSAAELANGYRLACCTRVYSAARIKIIGRLGRAGDRGEGQHHDAEQQVEL